MLEDHEIPTSPALPFGRRRRAPMTGRAVVSIPYGALGFDTDQRLTAGEYEAMAALGFKFAGRYLGDLTSAEIDDANGHGIGIVPIAHAHAPGWAPDAAIGAHDGVTMAQHAGDVGIIPMPLWADTEGCAPGTTDDALLAYAQAVCAPVVRAGHEARVYIGAGVPGDPVALYRLPYTGYWKSQSDVVTPAKRGWQMVQLFIAPRGECTVGDVFPNAPPNVHGLLIDLDVATCDYFGGRPRMLVNA